MVTETQAAPYDNVSDVLDEFQTTYTGLSAAALAGQGDSVSSMTISATGQVRTRSVRRSNPIAGLLAPADPIAGLPTDPTTVFV